MKISIAWIFDHIDADWRTVNIADLVTLFNKKTAEIEGWHHVSTDLTNLSFGQVTSSDAKIVTVAIPEWDTTGSLPARPHTHIGDWLLLAKDTKNNNQYRWATSHDLGGDKESMLPSIYLAENMYGGDWKKIYEKEDAILEVDNKSITNRPDMWGHRGFAREVAALLNLTLKPMRNFLHTQPIETAEKTALAGDLSITIEDTAGCARFAGLEVTDIHNKPSLMWMAGRLARVDSKPINAIVDFTNYVMLDISQPMHAFDANLLPTKNIIIGKAQDKQKLTLLDDEEIELTDQDIVVYDGTQPIALAGVMGGKATQISKKTDTVLLESANFDATTIRLTAALHKKRTEASTRFEKSLDPMQNINAIECFLHLCDNAGITYNASQPIISLGKIMQPMVISISHAFIERKLGTAITQEFIIKTLQALACELAIDTKEEIIYHVTVPTFRCTKDVRIKEDIVEELGRFFGYDNIPETLPYLQLAPSDTKHIMRERTIKKVLAYAGKMREVYTYSLYDESFLQKINWQPAHAVTIKNPVSEHWQSMVTSLIPNLLKTVDTNYPEQDQLRFFEWARVWQQADKAAEIIEEKALAGIIFDKKQPINFYDAKAILQNLFDELRITITWQRVDAPELPWFAPYQTAHLTYNDTFIGTAGIANPGFLNTLCEGHGFIFELNGDALLESTSCDFKFSPTSKYPEVVRDVSMLIPLAHTADEITHLIANRDPRIISVDLIDFFEKKEWINQKSLTFRFVLRDMHKTLTKDDVDAVYTLVIESLQTLGATIR